MRNSSVIGWDIGGVNTKVARVRDGVVLTARSHPYEIQRDPHKLGPLLSQLAEAVGAEAGDRYAVTMTAELSQMFRTKRDGVAFVLDAVSSTFPSSDVRVFTADGRFLSPEDARREPLAVAASNWAATATVVAAEHADAILIDIGTTTTDIIPIEHGEVVALGNTDPARLASGELVYTGTLRTAIEAIVHAVPLGDSVAGVSAEAFALIGDVHVWRGDLASEDYSVATPDGRPASHEFAGERLARVVCADRELLDDRAISAIANAVAAAQVDLVARAITRVNTRHPRIRCAIVTGLGSFIAERAAHQVGLEVARFADAIGEPASRCAPAAAVALLLDRGGSRQPSAAHRVTPPAPNAGAVSTIDVVVKVGGALLAYPHLLDATLAYISDAADDARMIIVPGGGPFADAVRAADDRAGLDDDTAHWMAVLAMDQYAHLIAGRHPNLVLASDVADAEAILARKQVPVLAPYRWLRDADPLPHTWDVTSDSISAWIAGALGASQLVLVKPPGVDVGTAAVDPYFTRSLSPDTSPVIVAADATDALSSALLVTARR